MPDHEQAASRFGWKAVGDWLDAAWKRDAEDVSEMTVVSTQGGGGLPSWAFDDQSDMVLLMDEKAKAATKRTLPEEKTTTRRFRDEHE